MNRLRIIIISVTAVIIMVGLMGLRRQLNHSATDPDASIEEVDDSDINGQTSRNRSSRVAALDEEPDPTPPPRKPRPRVPSGYKEDYEMAKLRAFGDAWITGSVTDEDEKALPGVRVELFEDDPMTTNPPLRTAMTDNDGSFTLEDLNDGMVRFILVARMAGYAPHIRDVALDLGPRDIDIMLERGVALSGFVRDVKTSATVPGATIYHPVRGRRVYGLLGSIKSGPAGQFSFSDVSPGEVSTLAECQGYARANRRLRAPKSDAEILLNTGGSIIRGVTVAWNNQKPIGGAQVRAFTLGFEQSVMSKDDGAFEIKDVPAGNLMLMGRRGIMIPAPPMRVSVPENGTLDDVQVVVPSDLFISGRVVHASEGHPLPGITIYYRGTLGIASTLSDEQGRFAFETLTRGNYEMMIRQKGFLPVHTPETTGTGEQIICKTPFGANSDSVEIRLRPVASIQGQAKGYSKGKEAGPVWGASVQVMYKQQNNEAKTARTVTDAAGYFFVNLPDNQRGFSRIRVSNNSAQAAASARIPTRKTAQLTMKPLTLKGTLYLSDKSPLSGVGIASACIFPTIASFSELDRMSIGGAFTNYSGRFQQRLPENQTIELEFRLPDGQNISKLFKSEDLTKESRVFVYDPVTRDILTEVKSTNSPKPAQTRQGGGRQGRGGGTGGGGGRGGGGGFGGGGGGGGFGGGGGGGGFPRPPGGGNQ